MIHYLIVPVIVSPWVAGIVWALLRGGWRLADPPPSYSEQAERQLSVR